MNRKAEKWLPKAFDYERPQQGEIRKGILLELDEAGATIDVGLKHDGLVPREDLQRLEAETLLGLKPGQEITTQVVSPTDQEGGLVLSLYQVQAQKDWAKAQAFQQRSEIWWGKSSAAIAAACW